jgi:glycosyltransferase involved in cell wall biosynthesis
MEQFENSDRPRIEPTVRPVLAPPTAESIGRRRAAPTFSAIIAAYQATEFIGDAIESLLAQTLPPIEIIVCDDASTDDLAGAVAPYRERVVLLHRQENGGPAAARNTAARAASGDFLAVLDSDDVYLPERLEALAELSVHRPDLDVLTTDCLVVVDGRFARNCYHAGYRFAIDDQRRAILEENFVGPGHMAVRRERFLAVGGFDESFRRGEDWDCWIRMIFSGSRVGLVNQPLAEYRVRETSLASDRIRLFEGRVAVLEKAALRSDLSNEERAVLTRSLLAERRRLALRKAHAALVEGRPDARRLALEIALTNSFPPGARLKAAMAVALPGLARRRLAAQDRGRRELAGGVSG